MAQHYLFIKALPERAFFADGPYESKERCVRRLADYGCVENIGLHKEFPDGTPASTVLAYKEEMGRAMFTWGNLQDSSIWNPSGARQVGPNWGISPNWDTIPAIGDYYAGYVDRSRHYFRRKFTNPGEALRFAAEKIAALPRDPDGYQAFPRIAINIPANSSWFVPAPVPELIGEGTPENCATIKDVTDALPSPTCGKCGFMGHRKSECPRGEKAHDRVGIEVEGRWLDLRAMKTKAYELTGTVGTGDGSVYRDNQLGADPWEFQTKPANIKGALEQTLAIYPDSVDTKCGMHVHVSFSATDIGFFTHPEFFVYFKARWLKWGEENNIHPDSEFYTRLNGGNNFCMPNRPAGSDPTNMDRYAQLNFSAWREHKTVECRLLPMFRRQSLAVSAVNELLAIFEDYLAQPDLVDKLYSQEVILPTPTITPWKETKEYVVPNLDKTVLKYEIVMNELPPVAKGMRRVALPTGRTAGSNNTNWSKMLLATQGKAE